MSLVNNTIYSIITFSFRALSGTVVMFYFGRVLQIHDFGNFNYALALATIMLVIMGYGYDTYLLREISQKRCNVGEAFINTIIPKIVIVLISLGITFGYIRINKLDSELSKVIWILQFSSIFNSFGRYINSIQKGENLFKIESIVSIVQNSLICVSSIIAIKYFNANMINLSVIYCISYQIGFLISFIHLFKNFKDEIAFRNFSFLKNIIYLKESLPFAVASIFMVLYFQIDTLIIGNYLGTTTVGQYQSVMRIIFAIMIIPEVLFNSFYPSISFSLISNKIDKFSECFKLLKLLMVIAVSISVLIFLFSDLIMRILYNHKYDDAAPLLFLFSIVVIARFAAMSYGTIVVASRHQNLQLISSIIATCLSLILNISLVPKYGLKMAVVNSFCVNLFIFLFYFISIYRIYKISFFSRELLKQTIPIVFIGLFAYGLKIINTHLAFFITLFLLCLYGIKLSKSHYYNKVPLLFASETQDKF
jgi:O-antigen/teichoic acid export membrane protein